MTADELKVFDSVALLGGHAAINPLTVAHALPSLDVYAIMQRLVECGYLQATESHGVKLAPPVATPTTIAPLPEVKIAEPKRRPPRPYFAHLDARKDPGAQIAARIVQYLCLVADDSGRVRYWALYQNLHGSRYRNWRGHDLWADALNYLGRAVCRERGFIWLDESTMVSDLPSPYKPLLKFTPRKRKPRTAWYRNVTARAEANGLSISEQIAADRWV